MLQVCCNEIIHRIFNSQSNFASIFQSSKSGNTHLILSETRLKISQPSENGACPPRSKVFQRSRSIARVSHCDARNSRPCRRAVLFHSPATSTKEYRPRSLALFSLAFFFFVHSSDRRVARIFVFFNLDRGGLHARARARPASIINAISGQALRGKKKKLLPACLRHSTGPRPFFSLLFFAVMVNLFFRVPPGPGNKFRPLKLKGSFVSARAR